MVIDNWIDFIASVLTLIAVVLGLWQTNRVHRSVNKINGKQEEQS